MFFVLFIFEYFQKLLPENSDAFFPFGDVSIVAGSEPHAEQVDTVTRKNENLKMIFEIYILSRKMKIRNGFLNKLILQSFR